MKKSVFTKESDEIDGVFRQAGELVVVPASYENVSREVAKIDDVEGRNQRQLNMQRIPGIIAKAPEPSRDALREYLAKFPNDVKVFTVFPFGVITNEYVEAFTNALKDAPSKIKRLIRNPGKIDQILKAKKPGRGKR